MDESEDHIASGRGLYVVRQFLNEPTSSSGAKMYTLFSASLVMANCISMILETLPQWVEWAEFSTFFIIESACTFVFTIELILRFASARNRLRFFIRPDAIIDFISVIPYYFELSEDFKQVNSVDFFSTSLRLLRLVRVFRVLTLTKLHNKVTVLKEAAENSWDSLLLMLNLFGIVCIVSSSCMFYAERGSYDFYYDIWVKDDGMPSFIQSIPEGFYWVVVTLGTVGYGDQAPDYTTEVSSWGKFISVFTTVVGVVLISMPISIIGINFTDAWEKMMRKTARKDSSASLAARKNEELVSVTGSVEDDVTFSLDLHNLLHTLAILEHDFSMKMEEISHKQQQLKILSEIDMRSEAELAFLLLLEEISLEMPGDGVEVESYMDSLLKHVQQKKVSKRKTAAMTKLRGIHRFASNKDKNNNNYNNNSNNYSRDVKFDVPANASFASDSTRTSIDEHSSTRQQS